MINQIPEALKSEGDINLTYQREAWQATAHNNQTRALLNDDARYFLHQSLSSPCLNVLTRAQGAYIEDMQGRRYLDFHGNQVHQVGFGNQAVIEAIKTQLDELSFCTRRYTNHIAVDLARKLAQITPGNLSRVLLAPGGAEANGMALKLARVATGRHKFISMWDSFHGATLDTISVSGVQTFRRNIGPLLSGVEHAPPPDEYRCLWDCSERGGCDLKCANYVEYVLEKEGDVAAVIAEPVRGIPYIPRPQYWQQIREACNRHGTLLIFDEIPYSLGRTGKMFVCEHFDVVPDILVMGKGLGGGILPLAAIIAKDELNVAAEHALGHYTHEKNPILCAAALATLNYIETHNLPENAKNLGEYTLNQLKQLQTQHPLIGDVRGLGLLLGVELVRNRGTKERATVETEQVMYAALHRGLSFKVMMGNIIGLTPPLTITREEMDNALKILSDAIANVTVAEPDREVGG
jgi:4-aminobutyrate aminotransferase